MSPDAASRFADRHPLRRSAPSRHSAFRCFAASCAIWVLSGLWPGSLAISAGASTDDAPVVVGCLEDDPPFSAQSAGEAPRGLLPDLWRLWARTTGRDVSFRCGPRSAIVDELSSGRVTVHAGVVPSSELDRFVVYGEPLYPVSSAVVHRRDLTDPLTLEGRTLGVRRGSAEARLAASAFPRARIVETEGPEGLFQGLVRGDIDAALTGTLSAADLARQPALHDRFTVAAARYLENQFRPAMLRSRGHEITAIDRG